MVIVSRPRSHSAAARLFRSDVGLGGLTLLSYATTLTRDLVLVQVVGLSDKLDRTSLTLAICNQIAAVVGLVISIQWSVGLSVGIHLRWLGLAVASTCALAFFAPGLVLAPVVTVVAALLPLAAVKAAASGQLLRYLLAGVVSPIPAILAWTQLRTVPMSAIFLGYLAGSCIQVSTSLWASRGAIATAGTVSRRRGFLRFSLLSQAATLVLLPVANLLRAGSVTTVAFGISIVWGVSLVVAGPLSARSMAGVSVVSWRSPHIWVATIGGLLAAPLLFIAAHQTPVWRPDLLIVLGPVVSVFLASTGPTVLVILLSRSAANLSQSIGRTTQCIARGLVAQVLTAVFFIQFSESPLSIGVAFFIGQTTTAILLLRLKYMHPTHKKGKRNGQTV